MTDSSILSCEADCVNIDIGITSRCNWHWLEKKVTVNVKKVLPSSSWNNGKKLTYFVGESIRKVQH